jgi:uncharacterized membrane protein
LKPINIAIDLTKGQERFLLRELKDLQSSMINRGILFSHLVDDPISLRKIEPYDVVILISPVGERYRPNEIKALLNFVESGGGLLVASRAGGDETLGTNLSTLLKHFNIKLGEGKVLNLDPNAIDPSAVDGITSLVMPGIVETDNILFYNAVSLIAKPDRVLISSESDEKGLIYPLAVFGQKGAGRVMVFGSLSPFDDTEIGIQNPANAHFFHKVISWLSKRWEPFTDEKGSSTALQNVNEDSLEQLIKNLLPEISEIVDKNVEGNESREQEFEVESTVIRILRAFLANALKEAHDNRNMQNIQIEGFDQLIMFLNRISKNLEKITDFINGKELSKK